jgi:hypothetical protein
MLYLLIHSSVVSVESEFFEATICGADWPPLAHPKRLRITSIQHDPSSQTATIHFEKSSAAKTALMLDGGTLDGSHLNVTSDTVHPDVPDNHEEHPAEGAPIEQSDKPRAGSACNTLVLIVPVLMSVT